MSSFIYVDAAMASTGNVTDSRLLHLSERHRLDLARPLLTSESLAAALRRSPDQGIIFEMGRGWPGRTQLAAAARALRQNRMVLFHWPDEEAVEVIDTDRLASYLALWAIVAARRLGRKRTVAPCVVAVPLTVADENRLVKVMGAAAITLRETARPVTIPADQLDQLGHGVYLRSDFWCTLTTGGSYGHTCYVAKELGRISSDLTCLLPHSFDLLDQFHLKQIILDSPSLESNERDLLAAGPTFRLQLRPLLDALRPAYIYERLCLGNMVGAQLSAELDIPYVVEYNGSELSMRRSFDGTGYAHEALFDAMELGSFAQATVISVVSEPIRQSLLARGVAPERVLVNPNGTDPDVYCPAEPYVRAQTRKSLGFTPDDCVVGFIGTFGGWHGINVLAEAIPLIASQCPRSRFLLIGDGPHRNLIDEAVVRNALFDRVVMTGQVPHHEGPGLLAAADVLVSPHSANMIDGPFFGSPTKLFEYMGMGQGIVASNLEQIGEVLSPGLSTSDIGIVNVSSHRAVLCRPGDVSDFVIGVCALANDPELSRALGANARKAMLASFTWEKHVERLWRFIREQSRAEPRPLVEQGAMRGSAPDSPGSHPPGTLDTGDSYKDQVQQQWNSDPCGSQYVKSADPHTLDWYLEAERYRYQEYGPWMRSTMEFEAWNGRKVLEIGAGMGTDLAQFAASGAVVTDYDLSAGHLERARENFALRGLRATFLHGDAETLPLEDETFDLVYSNGVIHHTPNTDRVVAEAYRVLKPGGQVTVMVYAERSINYWVQIIGRLGLEEGMLANHSVGEIMSRNVEISTSGARPLVKVYTPRRLRRLFGAFTDISISRHQLLPAERPPWLRSVPTDLVARFLGWNLVVKARKLPAGS
ncbi:MAG: methyltransferase domain-containing protein [Acidimicrobiales bacterium]